MGNSWELYVKNSSIGGFVTATTEIKIYNLKHYKNEKNAFNSGRSLVWLLYGLL